MHIFLILVSHFLNRVIWLLVGQETCLRWVGLETKMMIPYLLKKFCSLLTKNLLGVKKKTQKFLVNQLNGRFQLSLVNIMLLWLVEMPIFLLFMTYQLMEKNILNNNWNPINSSLKKSLFLLPITKSQLSRNVLKIALMFGAESTILWSKKSMIKNLNPN